MNESVSIPELVERARGGDAAARERLFARCRSYVGVAARAQVESWLRAKVDASDIVQQTLLDVHRGLEQFRGETEAEWLAWLRRILNHNATDFVRQYRMTKKRQAGREVPLQPGGDDSRRGFANDPCDPSPSPSQIVVQRERELELSEALTRLSADHQEVILLRNLQRLPFDEVARRMGRTRPATQMLWMRAIRKLQDQMTGASDVHPA